MINPVAQALLPSRILWIATGIPSQRECYFSLGQFERRAANPIDAGIFP
jgi:hypothetical protein